MPTSEDRLEAHSPEHDDRSARLLALAVTAIAAVVMLWPALRGPSTLAIGVPEGEGPAHLWGLTTSAEGLSRFGPFIRDSVLVSYPDGIHLDLVDPLHLLFIAPGVWLAGVGGATLGWNLMHLVHLGLLALGSWLLARQVEPQHPWVAALTTAGAVSTPYLWSGVALGRSELLGLTLLPLLLALFVQAARSPAPGWARVGGALALAALAACGWQPLLQGALVGIPAALLIGRLANLEPRRAAIAALWIVLPAALLTVPMLASHLASAPWWVDRAGGLDVLGSGAPSIDLRAASRLFGFRPQMSMTVAPYPGWVVLLLLGLALVRGPRGRAAFGVFLLILMMGPRFNFGDPEARLLGPSYLLARLIPVFGGLNDWGRLALAAGPILALIGASALAPWLRGARAPAVAGAVSLLLLVDGLSYRIDAPLAFDTKPPADVVSRYTFLKDGPILELPGNSPAESTSIIDNDRSMLWALTHRHPVQATPSPYGSPMLSRSILMRLHDPMVPRRVDPCLITEEGRLYALGFRSVVLLHVRLRAMSVDEMLLRLQPALGPPTGRNEAISYWSLQPGPTGPEDCAPPPLMVSGAPDAGQNKYGSPPPSKQLPSAQD